MYILERAWGPNQNEGDAAISDVVAIAFYFLLRPGEYTGTTSDDTPFLMQDIMFFKGNTQLPEHTALLPDIEQATAVGLTFTTQKNGIRNEKIVHGLSGHPLCCPVKATARTVLHLRHNQASEAAPLASYYLGRRHHTVKTKDVTDVLRFAASALVSKTGLTPQDISARSLRAGGAMALLCGNVDQDLIKLLGRWRSDAMMRYLFVQAEPIMKKFASAMFNNGAYSFLPGDTVPILANE
jgi:hypothetical protein